MSRVLNVRFNGDGLAAGTPEWADAMMAFGMANHQIRIVCDELSDAYARSTNDHSVWDEAIDAIERRLERTCNPNAENIVKRFISEGLQILINERDPNPLRDYLAVQYRKASKPISIH